MPRRWKPGSQKSLFLARRGEVPLPKLRAVVAGDGAVGRVRTEAAGVFSFREVRASSKAQDLLAMSGAPSLEAEPRNGLFWNSARDGGW